MRSFLAALLAALLCVGLACAQTAVPPPPADDALGSLIAEKGLLGTVSTIGGKVGNQASDLVASTLGFLGVPYRRGGATLETGFDCSGFVKYMFENTLGLVLPRSAAQQAAATEKIDSSELKPGDLVFFQHHAPDFQPCRDLCGKRQIHPFAQTRRRGAHRRHEDQLLGAPL